MAAFRTYLESRGGELAGNNELAALFALPYVPDPAQHPSFKKLFLVCSFFSLSHIATLVEVILSFCSFLVVFFTDRPPL